MFLLWFKHPKNTSKHVSFEQTHRHKTKKHTKKTQHTHTHCFLNRHKTKSRRPSAEVSFQDPLGCCPLALGPHEQLGPFWKTSFRSVWLLLIVFIFLSWGLFGAFYSVFMSFNSCVVFLGLSFEEFCRLEIFSLHI